MRPLLGICQRLIAYGLMPLALDVARNHKVKFPVLFSARKEHAVARARHELYAAIAERNGWMLRLIGELFGASETTVCDGIAAHRSRQGGERRAG